MGTLLGDALARAGLVSKEDADQAARMAEEDRKRKEIENNRRKHAAARAEEEAMKGRVLESDRREFDEEFDG
jgi:hypothetical protein